MNFYKAGKFSRKKMIKMKLYIIKIEFLKPNNKKDLLIFKSLLNKICRFNFNFILKLNKQLI